MAYQSVQNAVPVGVSNSGNQSQSSKRLNELLNAIKEEFSVISQEANSYKLQNQKDYDVKLSQQINELQTIRSTVYELEVNHRKIKDAYEEEINRLKMELEQRDRLLAGVQGQPAQPVQASQPVHVMQQLPPPPPPHLAGGHMAPGRLAPPGAYKEDEKPAPQQAPAAAPAAAAAPQQSSSEDGGNLVPVGNKSSHQRAIPPFLLEEASLQNPAFKKTHNDYYVLYNPELPRNMDVEMAYSLDHSSVVCCVRFSANGEFLATGCNKTTQVYSVETGELVARLTDENSTANNNDLYIRSVCFSPDGKYLATGAEDRLIRIWDLTTKQIITTLSGHEQDIYSLDFFPDGNRLVSGSGDRTVRIWDLRTKQCSLTLSIEDGVTAVVVAPDGKLIAAGSLDRTVRVWDATTGFLVERLDSENDMGTGHKDSVYSVCFTRDGSGVISGSLDRTVKLWNLRQLLSPKSSETGSKGATCEVTYVGHKDLVLSVATTPDDQYILSGSKDRGVLFWDKATGNPMMMLQGHRNSVISVAVANLPNGGTSGVFATGSGDCKARIWRWTKN